jgi:hypothetical protein
MWFRVVAIAAVFSGCETDDPHAVPPGTVAPTAIVTKLSDTDRLVRASMALRGIRPSVADIQQIQADPTQFEALIDGYVQSPEFLEVIKDLHAERLLLRTDTQFQLPVLGPLEASGFNQADVYSATTESPLRFVAEVVAEDLPYTEVVTADWMLTNDVLSQMYGLSYDPAGPEWQKSQWSDGRPLAGLLSDSEMWRRHVSNGFNFHRGRANLVADAFLCEDFASRDVLVEGGIQLSDPNEVSAALVATPSCVGCHQSLDPLAAFFWGYKEQIMRNAVTSAYAADCAWNWENGEPYRGSYRPEHFCYPLKFYEATEQDGWEEYGLRPPSYYGTPGTDTTDLGDMIAEDPRFSMCTVRNFYAYLAEVARVDVPLALATTLRDDFVASNYSAKQLAKAIVMSEPFGIATVVPTPAATGAPAELPFAPGIQVIRPEQYARTISDLTGFAWLTDMDGAFCADPTNICWGDVNLANTDRYGYRAMFGGVDGLQVTAPIIGATPTKVMVMSTMGSEAAGFVVTQDFLLPATSRKLLTLVEPTTIDAPTVRAQLAALHLRILGEVAAIDGPEVDASYALFSGALAGGSSPESAWKTVIAAFFQDPRMLFY